VLQQGQSLLAIALDRLAVVPDVASSNVGKICKRLRCDNCFVNALVRFLVTDDNAIDLLATENFFQNKNIVALLKVLFRSEQEFEHAGTFEKLTTVRNMIFFLGRLSEMSVPMIFLKSQLLQLHCLLAVATAMNNIVATKRDQPL